MVEISAREMIEAAWKREVRPSSPPLRYSISIQDRIDDIITSVLIDEHVVPAPKEEGLSEEEKIKTLLKWQEDFERAKEKKLGRKRLVEKLPDYRTEEKILQKIKDKYSESPAEAGNYAEQYISSTPFITYYGLKKRPLEEINESVRIGTTNNIVHWRFDSFAFDAGIYEFKLTKNNLQRSLEKATLQIFLYDFLWRLKYNKRHHNPMIIEICIIDDEKINRYGGLPWLTDKEYFVVDKDVLKAIFRENHFDDLEKIYSMIDEIYDHLEVTIEEDVTKMYDESMER
jgi:hypothetical protein